MDVRLSILLGALFGLILDDVLRATGLHWLVWPLIGGLGITALVITFFMRRRGASGDDGI